MAVPTTLSEGQKLSDLVNQGANLMASIRLQCVSWKASMAAGPVNAEIIEQIASYMAGNLPKLQAMTRKQGFDTTYAVNVGPAYQIDNSDVNIGTDRITGMDDHTFAVGDQIIFPFSMVEGALPTGLSVDTQYWVIAAPPANVQLSATQGGGAINITAAGSGTAWMLYNINPVWGAITNPTTGLIFDIQTELEAMDKVDGSGWHQARKIDDTQEDGYSHNTYSSAETATLQTKLQDLIDAIRAPA